MVLKIISIPNMVLTNPAKSVGVIDKKILKLIADMTETLVKTKNPKGVGLAATQVGVGLRIFLTRPTENSETRVFINPEIIESSTEEQEINREHEREKSIRKDNKLEGCLSIPNVWGYLKRKKSVRLKYMNEKGENHQEVFSGFMATIVQHETDHLNGILFPQRVLEQKEKLYEIERDEKGEETLVEIRI